MISQGSTSKSIWNCPGFSNIPRLLSGLLPQRLSASADEWGALSALREGWPMHIPVPGVGHHQDTGTVVNEINHSILQLK